MDRKNLKNVPRILTLRCDESAQLISRAQETPLSRSERWAIGLHLLVCKSCRKYKEQMKILRAILTKMTKLSTYDTKVPSPLNTEQTRALRERISKKIQESLDSM